MTEKEFRELQAKAMLLGGRLYQQRYIEGGFWKWVAQEFTLGEYTSFQSYDSAQQAFDALVEFITRCSTPEACSSAQRAAGGNDG